MIGSFQGNPLGLSPLFVIGLGVLAVIIAIIIIVLKGYSLWYAAQRNEKWWFIVLLIVNTAGILELIYLIFFVKKWSKGGSVSAPDTTPTQTPQI